jgi:uncharacterized protein
MTFDWLVTLLPEGVSPLMAFGLAIASLIASALTATFSLGGGILMLSVLTLIFPAAVVVPVHGAVQLGSNAGRAFLQRIYVQWHLVLWISLGAILGTLVGGRFASLMPENVFKFIIGIFILFMIWVPRPDVQTRGPVMSFVGGAVISFTGMIVGVTGPLVLTFIRAIGDRRALVATHAALMTFQNTAKIVAFVAYGFAFAEFLPLILAMVATGFIGTAIGTRLLHRLPETAFRYGFKIVITLMALDLLWRAIFPG